MNKVKEEMPRILLEIILELFNHGWAEELEDAINYNRITPALKKLVDGANSEDVVRSTQWVEEFDFNNKGAELFSFAENLIKIFRKYNILNDNLPERTVKRSTTINYSFNCPHCDQKNMSSKEDIEVKCIKCLNPVRILDITNN